MKDASFSFETGQGTVRYDSTLTNPEAFIAELERLTGYSSTVKPGGENGGGRSKGS